MPSLVRHGLFMKSDLENAETVLDTIYSDADLTALPERASTALKQNTTYLKGQGQRRE